MPLVDGIKSVLGPAEGGEGGLQTGQGQTDDVEVAAFDAGNEAAGAALDGIGAGFVVGFAGGKVTVDVFSRKRGKMHQGGFDESDAFGVREADEGDSGDDGVREAGESFEHVASVVGGAGLAEDAAFECDFGIGANDDGWADGAGSDEFGFGESQTLDEVVGGFAGVSSFVNGGGEDGEGEAGVVEDFGAANGSGGKDQLHKSSRMGRILQREGGDSLCFGPGDIFADLASPEKGLDSVADVSSVFQLALPDS